MSSADNFRWEHIGLYGSYQDAKDTVIIDEKTFPFHYTHPLFLPPAPEEQEYENVEQLRWKHRGYALAEVSIHGLYQGQPLHEDEDSDTQENTIKLSLLGKLKSHKQPERV